MRQQPVQITGSSGSLQNAKISDAAKQARLGDSSSGGRRQEVNRIRKMLVLESSIRMRLLQRLRPLVARLQKVKIMFL